MCASQGKALPARMLGSGVLSATLAGSATRLAHGPWALRFRTYIPTWIGELRGCDDDRKARLRVLGLRLSHLGLGLAVDALPDLAVWHLGGRWRYFQDTRNAAS